MHFIPQQHVSEAEWKIPAVPVTLLLCWAWAELHFMRKQRTGSPLSLARETTRSLESGSKLVLSTITLWPLASADRTAATHFCHVPSVSRLTTWYFDCDEWCRLKWLLPDPGKPTKMMTWTPDEAKKKKGRKRFLIRSILLFAYLLTGECQTGVSRIEERNGRIASRSRLKFGRFEWNWTLAQEIFFRRVKIQS